MSSNILAHNLAAINAQRQIGLNNKKRNTAMERLSSGFKINRAADDASGLAISEKMRRQIRGLTQGAHNIEEGISYCKIADGALNEIHDMLNRMEELAVKSANGTNSENDRKAIDEEIQQIKAETEKILGTTKYNEIYIWKGGNPISTTVQTGTKEVPAVEFPLNILDECWTELDPTNDNAASYPKDGMINIDIDKTNGIRFYWTGFNGKAYYSNWKEWPPDEEAQINDPSDPNKMITRTHPGAMNVKISDLMDYTLYPEAKGIDARLAYITNAYSTQDDLLSALADTYCEAGAGTREWFHTYKSDGSLFDYLYREYNIVSITFPAIIKSQRDLDNTSDTSFARAIPSNSTNLIKKPSGSDGNYSGTWEFQFEFDNIGLVTASLSEITYRSDNEHYFHVAPNKDVSGVVYSISKILQSNTGEISLHFNLTAETPFKIGTDSQSYTTVGKLEITIGIGGTLDSAMSKILEISGCDIFASSDKNNNSDSGAAGKNVGESVVFSPNYDYSIIIPTYDSVLQEDPNGYKTIPIHTAPESTENVRVLITYPILNLETLGLSDTNVLTADNALQALDDIQYAAEMISDSRVLFGSYQNRLEHAYNGTMNTVENTTASESRIRDADIAELTYWYSLNQILVNAGESILAQAVKNSETVLNLIK
ncbi:flagellin C-terminal helical region [Lachnospiraceae bacterium]|nr:flagellin C-terminal helical region [Lachnospiraceae bacterium]